MTIPMSAAVTRAIRELIICTTPFRAWTRLSETSREENDFFRGGEQSGETGNGRQEIPFTASRQLLQRRPPFFPDLCGNAMRDELQRRQGHVRDLDRLQQRLPADSDPVIVTRVDRADRLVILHVIARLD